MYVPELRLSYEYRDQVAVDRVRTPDDPAQWLPQAMGLADRETEAREAARALGCCEDELPLPHDTRG
jgi:hypothetical protein